MKKTLTFLIILTIALLSCENNELDFAEELKDGFCIVANNKVVLDHNDFDYYDYFYFTTIKSSLNYPQIYYL